MVNLDDLSIYIHWPFCKSKCPYCDFNSHVRKNIDQNLWLNSYLTDIEYHKNLLAKSKINSIFFGGGTPSLANPQTIEAIIDKIADLAGNIPPDIEITMEANPTSIEQKKIASFYQAGVNRLSLGIQSFDDQQLSFLGREHSGLEGKRAIEATMKYYSNYSFDLIYALPKQTIAEWRKQLEYAAKLAPPHLSLYQLTIEPGTLFAEKYLRQQIEIPSSDLAADFYLATQDIMNKYNMPSYEVSNHAKVGMECQHNMSYWLYRDYLGIGPGAHSRISYKNRALIAIEDQEKNNELQGNDRISKIAIEDEKNPEKWLKLINSFNHGREKIEFIDHNMAFHEGLVMKLRTKKGLTKSFLQKNHIDIKKLTEMAKLKLLHLTKDKVFLTTDGILLLNKVVENLIS